DVFAFGVVLFELLSGRQAVHLDGDKNLSLATWAQNYVKKRNLDQVIAVEIRGKVSPKSLKKFSQIACRCLDSNPNIRPTMSEVVVALQISESLQEKFENCAKPARLFGFTWKMLCYSVHPDKKNSGAMSKFKKHIINVGPHRVSKGWVHEKKYTPSKRGVGLAITVMYLEHRPKVTNHLLFLQFIA
ncbi:serine/threonine/dual specificity protein kinase, catalytic domain-containing protein, partial [Tanacetum coccineum]